MNDTDTLRWLVDLEALRSLAARYADAADDRDYDTVESYFHPDGEVVTPDGAVRVHDYFQRLRDNPSPFVAGTHLMGPPVIELEPGSDTATIRTSAVVHQISAKPDGEGDLTLGMRYEDHVVRDDGRWRIMRRDPVRRWARVRG